jgi:hypothetical protein
MTSHITTQMTNQMKDNSDDSQVGDNRMPILKITQVTTQMTKSRGNAPRRKPR